MPLWVNNDDANSVPIFAVVQLNQTGNTANRNAAYGNTTADAYITGQTTGIYAVNDVETTIGFKQLTAVVANATGSGGSYVPGDQLTANATGATVSTPATMNIVSTIVRTVTANAATGSNYTNGDTVTCNTGTMTTNAVFTVTTGAANTSVASLALTTNGVFTVNPTLADGALKNLVVANSQANGAKATLTMGVGQIAVVNPGYYAVAPTNVTSMIALNGANGSGTGLTMATTFSTVSRKGIAHTGWVKRTVGTGGRAGRVQIEVLVAGSITNGTNTAAFPNA